MLEFVLLGDPAVHPIASTVPSAARSGRAAASRRATLRAERRVARTVVAAEVEKALPTRSKAAACSGCFSNRWRCSANICERTSSSLAVGVRLVARRNAFVNRAGRSGSAKSFSAKTRAASTC